MWTACGWDYATDAMAVELDEEPRLCSPDSTAIDRRREKTSWVQANTYICG